METFVDLRNSFHVKYFFSCKLFLKVFLIVLSQLFGNDRLPKFMIDWFLRPLYLGIWGRWKTLTYKLFTNIMNILWILHLTINRVWICHLNVHFSFVVLVSCNQSFFFFFKTATISLALRSLQFLDTVPIVPSGYNATDSHNSSYCKVPGFGFFINLFLLQIFWLCQGLLLII